MEKNEITITENYNGTMESLESLVKNLKLKHYQFDVRDKSVRLIYDGITYRPGDSYQYRSQKNFKVIT